MQVDPIKPKSKAPGTKRLKLKCDEPLSNFAFKFNLRRCIKEACEAAGATVAGPPRYCSPRHRMPLNSRNEDKKNDG